MSASIVYCVEGDTHEICVDVYSDGVMILDEYVSYPYASAPTSDLQQCLEQYKTLIDDFANQIIACNFQENLIFLTNDLHKLVFKHNGLLSVLSQRPDYTP